MNNTTPRTFTHTDTHKGPESGHSDKLPKNHASRRRRCHSFHGHFVSFFFLFYQALVVVQYLLYSCVAAAAVVVFVDNDVRVEFRRNNRRSFLVSLFFLIYFSKIACSLLLFAILITYQGTDHTTKQLQLRALIVRPNSVHGTPKKQRKKNEEQMNDYYRFENFINYFVSDV